MPPACPCLLRPVWVKLPCAWAKPPSYQQGSACGGRVSPYVGLLLVTGIADAFPVLSRHPCRRAQASRRHGVLAGTRCGVGEGRACAWVGVGGWLRGSAGVGESGPEVQRLGCASHGRHPAGRCCHGRGPPLAAAGPAVGATGLLLRGRPGIQCRGSWA